MAENEQGVQAAWDDLNRVALEKLRAFRRSIILTKKQKTEPSSR